MWSHSFSAGSIVVHAGLLVERREDGVSLSKLDLASLLEVLKVPANERVVVRVCVRCDERSTPVNLQHRDTTIITNFINIKGVSSRLWWHRRQLDTPLLLFIKFELSVQHKQVFMTTITEQCEAATQSALIFTL